MGKTTPQRQHSNTKMKSIIKISCLMMALSMCQGYNINRRGQNDRYWNKRSDRQNSVFNPGRNGNGGFNNGNDGFNGGNNGYNNGNNGFNNGNNGFNNGNDGFN